MRVNWDVIKLLVVLLLIGGLFGFTQERNKQRKLTGIQVEFMDDSSPFITGSTVNKLLIQNNDTVTSIPKETLVLKQMESRLVQHEMVRDAQVYVTIDGALGAKIQQRNPIARVLGNPNYYIDEDGLKMPLSQVYAARVPLITGNSKQHFSELTQLLLRIQTDEFMRKSVIGVHRQKDGAVMLKMRKQSFKVHFGKPDDIDRKFQNFKAFYHKINKEDMLLAYSLVDLRFGNQVVASK